MYILIHVGVNIYINLVEKINKIKYSISGKKKTQCGFYIFGLVDLEVGLLCFT